MIEDYGMRNERHTERGSMRHDAMLKENMLSWYYGGVMAFGWLLLFMAILHGVGRGDQVDDELSSTWLSIPL